MSCSTCQSFRQAMRTPALFAARLIRDTAADIKARVLRAQRNLRRRLK